MRVQVIEQFHGGHHTNYVQALVPRLRRLIGSGQLKEVVISVTARHRDDLLRLDPQLALTPGLRVEAMLPEVSPAPSLAERRVIAQSCHASARAVGADALLCTSADYDVTVQAAHHLLGRRGFPKHTRTVGVMHYGYPLAEAASWKEKLKQRIYEQSWKHAAWDRLLLVNPVVYEDVKRRHAGLAQRMQLLPDPVPQALPIDRAEARQRLGLAEDGRYLGFIGMMDARKAIPELCAAFAAAEFGADVRLLLAGLLADSHRHWIQTHASELLRQGRLVLIDRPLSSEEVQFGYACLDVNTILQYRRLNLSANLLKAAAQGRPVVVDDCGYTGMLTRRFQLGELCRIEDPASVVEALRRAVAGCATYRAGMAVERLLRFHTPENFAHMVLQTLGGTVLTEESSGPLTWDWVCQSDLAR